MMLKHQSRNVHQGVQNTDSSSQSLVKDTSLGVVSREVIVGAMGVGRISNREKAPGERNAVESLKFLIYEMERKERA